MRKLLLSPTTLLIFLCFAFGNANAQQVFKTTSPSTIAYLEYVPQGYDTNSDKYPVMIFLHGIGERGPNSTDPAVLSQYINLVAKLGPPMYVKNGAQFPFILISPQLKNNYSTWPVSYVMEVINHVKNTLRIDEKRIFLTGLSLGGGGVWMTAQDFPELFAAIAPVCGGYNTPSKACNIASENLPVWAFHGDADTTVPLSRTVNMVNAINNCTPKPSPLAKITIYPNVGHNAWTYAYKNDNTLHNPNLYQWVMSYTNTINKGNKIPYGNAGADKSITTHSVNLTGSGTDADGSIVAYSWAQLKGPSKATLTNNLSSTVSLSNLVAGTYYFKLTVKDNNGNTDSDYVKVVVDDNIAPVANAGADKSISLPTNSVIVSGTGTDADGTISAYAWTKVSGSTASLSGTTTANLTASSLLAGSYVFRLTVTDNKGAKKSDDMTVNVLSSNVLPVANAGADKTITLPTNSVIIYGSGTDSDGTIASYQWSKISGSTATLSGTSTPTLTASSMVAGSYVFRLTVTDNKGGIKSDDVAVTVNSSSNILPVSHAGADQSITYPTNALNLYGSGTDADGTITYYHWSKVSGPSCYIYGVSKPTFQISQMYVGTYVFRLTVTDNMGATASDDVTVIVKDALTSAATLTSTPETIVDGTSGLSSSDDNSPVLGEFTKAQLQNSTVVIFNDSGEKIYAGNWSHETFREVLNKKGMYIYNVMQEGRRMNSGKIVIRD